MDQVTAFIDDGNLNSETFFLDEDEAPAKAGQCGPISVAGIFCFDVADAAPFTVTVRGKKGKALTKFQTTANAGSNNSIKDALSAATKSYSAIADALDAEMEEEMTDEMDGQDANDDGVLDALNDAAVKQANDETRKKKEDMAAELERINAKYDLSGLNKTTVDRILSDYEKVLAAKPVGWSAEPDGRQLNHWKVHLFDFEKKTPLRDDMDKVGKRTGKSEGTIDLEMTFPKEYPYKPPFIRVIRPRFMPRTGRVTIGGSICTELLTDDGWKPVFDIEAIIVTIRQQITDPESGAKIDHSNTHDFTMAEAKEAFERVAAYHKQNGW